ncbi:MAG TPA: helix-turn-helix domain-containing protein [Bacteroides mediterraneensis]|uniref:helix-turn-helix domain-containing protein n=1 Tax=Bacteroides mediterraneensis TaxID=1841856 RepID=UPI0026F0E28B|nr:helix-turn-helix domain-containing protein [Bacteroides mediterraneensis]HJH64347.1 helix-turn-helix domain-containing protein [Bacteroides mediterraneensis]
MEFVGIEKQMFEEMVRKFEQFEQKVMEICNQRNDKKLNKWMDNQEVCNFLNISPRTLQTLRDNGTLSFSQIKHKMFYKPEDVQNIAIRIKNNPHTTKKRV